MGARRLPQRAIRFHPGGAACRGEAPPRPYLHVADPHVIDGLGLALPHSKARTYETGLRSIFKGSLQWGERRGQF